MEAQPQDATKLIAFHGNPQIKADLLAQLRAHYAADEIVKGVYWENGRGCAVGCTIHSGDHAEYEPRFGIPQTIARFEDGIFEGLPNGRAKEWPLQFTEAIPVGADLSKVGAQFLRWLLVDPEHGVIKFADEQGRVAIQHVADMYAAQLRGDEISADDWRSAARAAYAAADAAYAAYAAADAAAYAAARAAAYAAARAAYAARAADAAYAAAYAARAADAAYAAAYAAADAAAYAAREIQADKLLELLRNAPVVVTEPSS